jgi:hypothetical protein
MAKVFAAFADGWGRVLRAPAILLGVFAVTWLVAFPAGRAMQQSSGGEFSGFSLMAWGLPTGFYPTFTPTLLGTGHFLHRARGFLAGGMIDVGFVAAAATTLLVWTFLLGGILDRYARRRPTRAQAFFGASGVIFFRFLRLGVIAALGYVLIFGLVHPLVFPSGEPWAAGDRAAAQPSLLLAPVYAVFLLLAAFWSAVIDYARIRAVVEDRRSMLGAILAGWRFVLAHPLETFGLFLLNTAAFGLLLWVALEAPTRWQGIITSGGRFTAAAGTLYLLVRLMLKLVFFASQTAFFQRSLAHADYTAAPTPLWPESPAAEEIINAAPRQDQAPR